MNSENQAKEIDYTQLQLPEYYKKNGDLGIITNSTGDAIFQMNASLTVGITGPIALVDWQLMDSLGHFSRERIPERVVHAKGASAGGIFTCTADITNYTAASIFAKVGKETPIRIRFSTVAGNLGSADTVRDPRGFAIKFYTNDGILDIAGLNNPMFVVRDPMMFPLYIHSQKRNPATNMRDWNAFWDFISLRHETVHHILYLMSDRGIPDGYRRMDGYGVHTYTLVNKDGEKMYCRFVFKTMQGVKNILSADATILAGSEPDYACKDLYNAIASGNFPKWKFYIQTMSAEQAEKSTFDPFDVTKVWPEKQFPIEEAGEFVLNSNPENYFAEGEQLSFSPASVIVGIAPSPQDRMLHGRMFSYHDAHLHRLGPNYTELPVNAPFRVKNFLRDGYDVWDNQGGAPNYHPNSFGGPNNAIQGRKSLPVSNVSGDLTRYDTSDRDNYSQAKVFYQEELKEDERQRVADNIVSSLKYTIKDIQERTMNLFKLVDEDLGNKIDKGLKKENELNVAI